MTDEEETLTEAVVEEATAANKYRYELTMLLHGTTDVRTT